MNISFVNAYMVTITYVMPPNLKFLVFAAPIRCYAQINYSFHVTTCVEINFLVAIIIVLKHAMLSRVSLQHHYRKQEESHVKSVFFLAKRCSNLFINHHYYRCNSHLHHYYLPLKLRGC